MRLYFHYLTARLYNRYSQYILTQPGCWSRSPTMRKAMTIALITIISICFMHIYFPGWSQLIYPRRIFFPINIKIFPKSRCTQIKHSAPVFFHILYSSDIISCQALSLKYIIPIKSRKSFSSSNLYHILICFLCRHNTG